MKFMGSKRSMLRNGLGTILHARASSAERVADLFTGSAAVAWYLAESTDTPVMAFDLQHFAVSLAGAVLSRDAPVNGQDMWFRWQKRAEKWRAESGFDAIATKLHTDALVLPILTATHQAREACSVAQELPIVTAYGGYYFSPLQALQLDSLRQTLPSRNDWRSVALAALVMAASQCAAAPGHTAQPFKPTETAEPYLRDAWSRKVLDRTKAAVELIAARRSKAVGSSSVADALSAAAQLTEGDLAFVDPPYSEVQYSRFYHVLETVALGRCSPVTGEGRYPPFAERPHSDFCLVTKSEEALDALLRQLSSTRVTTVLTFPEDDCSNGLSGKTVKAVGSKYFDVHETVVLGTFSTLGGNLVNRSARRYSTRELILELIPMARSI